MLGCMNTFFILKHDNYTNFEVLFDFEAYN